MNIFKWFEKKEESSPVKPFIVFPCANCQADIAVFTSLMPGDAVVTECFNCDVSWTIYNPSLVIKETTKLPKELQGKIWGGLSNEPG